MAAFDFAGSNLLIYGSYFRLPLPIFFADVFPLKRTLGQAKKDFRSSRAAASQSCNICN